MTPSRLPLISVLAGLTAAAAITPPASLLNLTSWDLQLPLADGKGGVVTIPAKDLGTYSSQFFFANDTDSSAVLWCPINGAHTSGSDYPRSELRQRPDFSFSGTHVLNVTMAMLSVPSGSKKVTIGQVHVDGISRACSIVSEFEYAAGGKLVNNVRTADCKDLQFTVGSTVPLGELFSFSLSIVGQTLRVWTSVGSLPDYEWPWMNTSVPIYFKSGAYVQQAGNSSLDGGSVKVTALTTSHSAK